MHNCLLGCQGLPDSLDHYYHCPHLHALTSLLIPETDSDPLVRFGLVHPNTNQFKVIACMFSAYHAVKSMVRTAQVTSGANIIDTSCGSEIRKNWSLFAQTFQAEACEMSVATRAFTLPKFIDFLVHDGVHRTDEPTLGNQVALFALHDNYVQSEGAAAAEPNILVIDSLQDHPT